MSFLSFFESLFCKDHLILIEDLKEKVIDKSKQNLAQAVSIAKNLKLIDYLEEENTELDEYIKELTSNLPVVYSAKKRIYHSWTNQKGKKVQIPVQNFVQPSCVEFAELARKHRLYLEDGIKDPEYDFKVIKAYVLAYNLVKYRIDSSNYGVNEHWEKAGNILTTGEDDCDGKAVVECSMLEHIGVPVTHVKVVIGKGFVVKGHATLCVKDSTGQHRHLNASNTIEKFDDLKKFPLFGINDKSFKTNSYNLGVIDYYFNSVFAEDKLVAEEALQDYVFKNDSSIPDVTQVNDVTQIAGWCKWRSPSGEANVPEVKIQINGRFYETSKAGTFQIKIPNTWLIGEATEFVASFVKEGYKKKEIIYSVKKGLTTSRVVWMLKG